jgi:hypothetical protein
MKARLELQPRTSGDLVCPFPIVKLRVRDRYGAIALLWFRIDSAADCSAIPVAVARREGLSFQQTRTSTAGGLVGTTTKFRDQIRVVLGGREHEWPCDFIVTPASSGQQSDQLRDTPVLGRAGFLQDYAITIDDGYLIITRLGPVRKLLRRILHAFWTMTGQIHPLEEPL